MTAMAFPTLIILLMGINIFIRDAIYMYRIILSLHRCTCTYDTKSNHIDISRIMIYQHIVACFNDLQSNYCTLWST